MYIFAKTLQYVKYQLKYWNRHCFGNIFHDKALAQSKLDNITREIRENGLSEALLQEEAMALKILEECEIREEIY
jgi:hypothetical protein